MRLSHWYLLLGHLSEEWFQLAPGVDASVLLVVAEGHVDGQSQLFAD